MGTTVALVSIVLALVAAGCIGYIAWELTSEENLPKQPPDDGPEEGG